MPIFLSLHLPHLSQSPSPNAAVQAAPSPAPADTPPQGKKSPRLVWIHEAKDVAINFKTKYNLVRTWDQDFGVQSTFARFGNLAEVTTFADDPIYPINFHRKPRYSLAFQFVYTFTAAPSSLGIYTKPKNNLIGLWREESGVTGRLYTSKVVIVSASTAFLYNYPYRGHQAPQWLAFLNVQFPLGR